MIMHRKLFVEEKDLTYAQQYLLKLADKKQLTYFWTINLEGKGFNVFYLYNVMVGENTPSIEFIWTLRNVINPILWFYKQSEKKPQPIVITREDKFYPYYESKNFISIENTKNFYTWCKKNNLNYNSTWLLKNKKRKITFRRMNELKNILPIKNWFIF